MAIHERIRAARKKAGLTLVELGARTSLSYQAIQKYEKNMRQPTPEVIQRIADVTGQSVDWLFRGGEMTDCPRITPEQATDILLGAIQDLRTALASERKRAEAAEAEVERLKRAKIRTGSGLPGMDDNFAAGPDK